MYEAIEFMENYFIYIWLSIMVLSITTLFILGKSALKMFDHLDLSHVVHSEKSASGYTSKSSISRRAGASRVLHIIITDRELVFKTNAFFAYPAKRHDLLQIIPLNRLIDTEVIQGGLLSKLSVKFLGPGGEKKEVVLISKRNSTVKEILDKHVLKNLQAM